MSKANQSRHNGDNFQARVLWRVALNLLDPQSCIVEIGFEHGEKGFDDVWQQFRGGSEEWREYMQCKWHTRLGEYGVADLIDPTYIGAVAHSLLYNAYQAYKKTKVPARFTLVTTDRVKVNDPLGVLYKNTDGSLRIHEADGLAAGLTENSKMGAVRAMWCKHLGINDAELLEFAANLRFVEISENLEEMRTNLNARLTALGFAGVAADQSVFDYDHLPHAWQRKGKYTYTREQFLALCTQEKLFEPAPAPVRQIGIKSFQHPNDNLAQDCDQLIDLMQSFSGRAIRDAAAWQGEVWPKLQTDLHVAMNEGGVLRLKMDVHTSIAFAAGVVLDTKCRRTLEIVQDNAAWPLVGNGPAQPGWDVDLQTLDGDAAVLVLVVEATRPAVADVRAYMQQHHLSAGRILVARIQSGVGRTSVRDGTHAVQLAADLSAKIAENRSIRHCHIFMSVPNVLSFCLGQHRESLGHVYLYEFDFGGSKEYQPSLRW